MSIRHVRRTLILGLAAVVCGATLATSAFVSAASASTLTSADGYTTLTTQGTVASATPYSSGQVITIAVGDNSTFNRSAMEAAGYPSGADPIKFLECEDPGGTTLPNSSAQCSPGTIHTISGIGSDGLGDMSTNYTVLALPDPNLGGGTLNCGYAPNYCVVGIFANQNDFTKPHLFSAPFVVSSNNGADDGSNPGDGTSTPVSITSASSATFTTGQLGNFQVTGAGTPAPDNFTEVGTLPGTVSLSTSGLLSGTTSQTGDFPITITASDGV